MFWIMVFNCLVFVLGDDKEMDFQNVNVEDLLKSFRQSEARHTVAVPGVTYPIYTEIKETSFRCPQPGYYADPQRQCQQYYRCDENGGKTTFLCPPGTLFHQLTFVCDFWYNIDCSQAMKYYSYANSRLYPNTNAGTVPVARQNEGTNVRINGAANQAEARFGVLNLLQSAAGPSENRGMTRMPTTLSAPTDADELESNSIEGVTSAIPVQLATTQAPGRMMSSSSLSQVFKLNKTKIASNGAASAGQSFQSEALGKYSVIRGSTGTTITNSSGLAKMPVGAAVLRASLNVNMPGEAIQSWNTTTNNNNLSEAGNSNWNPIQVNVFTACDKAADVEIQGKELLRTIMSSLKTPTPSAAANQNSVITVKATSVDSKWDTADEVGEGPMIATDAYYITENADKPVYIKFTKYNVVVEVRPDPILLSASQP